MTKPFCMACAEDFFGPKAIATMAKHVASAPPMSPEMKAAIRAVFQGAPCRPSPAKTCGHK